jgi:hypothetical protein
MRAPVNSGGSIPPRPNRPPPETAEDRPMMQQDIKAMINNDTALTVVVTRTVVKIMIPAHIKSGNKTLCLMGYC